VIVTSASDYAGYGGAMVLKFEILKVPCGDCSVVTARWGWVSSLVLVLRPRFPGWFVLLFVFSVLSVCAGGCLSLPLAR